MSRMRRHDEGMVSAFVVTLTLALLFAAGLAYDAGRMVDARIAAADVAAGAARAAAQHTGVDAEGDLRVDAGAAAKAARDFAPDYTVDVRCEGDTVTVTVRRSLDLTLLRLFGLERKNLGATHSATAVEG